MTLLKKNLMSPTPHTDPSKVRDASGLPRGMDALAYEIARVERRLIAREIGIHNRMQDIRQVARSALRPRRSMVPWAGALLMLWPFLPRFLRPRLSPASTITIAGMAAPAMKRLLTSHPAGPVTVAHLDLSRYMGQWYEVASFTHRRERGGLGVPATHLALAYQPDGSTWVDIRRQVPVSQGRMRDAQGVARVVPGSGGGRMKVSFLASWMRWWPGAWEDHWVLHVDADYTEALVGDPGRRELRVLSRDSVMEPARLHAMLDRAEAQGYDLSRMHAPTPAVI